MTDRLTWGTEALTIDLEWSAEAAPRIAAVRTAGVGLTMPVGLPLIEILTVCHGHALANDRLVHTAIGHAARYIRHEERTDHGVRSLLVEERHDATGLVASIDLSIAGEAAAVRSQVTVRNEGTEPVVLR
jgi:alpha-galactosidase